MNKCELCGSREMNAFHKGVRDDGNIDVLKCEDCGALMLEKYVGGGEFYKSELMHKEQYNAISDSIGEQTWESWIEETEKDDNRRFADLKKRCEDKDVLDFGCGNGGFLRRIKGVAQDCAGIELDPGARRHIAEEGIRVYETIGEANQKWDVITMFQVIEHLDNPRKWLTIIRDFLKDDGLLLIETPNADDALISLYKNRAFEDFTFWSAHVILYNSDILEKVVDEVGFRCVDNGQIQRYPLSNHLYWLSMYKPGGHEKWTMFNNYEMNQEYETILRENKMCDTLYALFQKI